jgi:hypothetical protein
VISDIRAVMQRKSNYHSLTSISASDSKRTGYKIDQSN